MTVVAIGKRHRHLLRRAEENSGHESLMRGWNIASETRRKRLSIRSRTSAWNKRESEPGEKGNRERWAHITSDIAIKRVSICSGIDSFPPLCPTFLSPRIASYYFRVAFIIFLQANLAECDDKRRTFALFSYFVKRTLRSRKTLTRLWQFENTRSLWRKCRVVFFLNFHWIYKNKKKIKKKT